MNMGTTAATGDGDGDGTSFWRETLWQVASGCTQVATRLHVALMIWREMQNTDGFGNYGRIDSRVSECIITIPAER